MKLALRREFLFGIQKWEREMFLSYIEESGTLNSKKKWVRMG